MEEVAGVSGGLPPLVAYPPTNVRASLPPQEWEACLDSWIFCVEYRLRLRKEHFSNLKISQAASGLPFLTTYLKNQLTTTSIAVGSKEEQLHRQCYFLLKRLLLETNVPYDYDPSPFFELLANGSVAFATIPDWRSALRVVFKRTTQATTAINATKTRIMTAFSATDHLEEATVLLQKATALTKLSSEAGLALITGTDYLEAIIGGYQDVQGRNANSALRKAMTEHTFYCLRSLMADASKQPSLLLDHIYLMKTEADRMQKAKPDTPTLLSSLVCSTSFLKHFRADNAVMATKRGQQMLDTLTTYRQHNLQHHPSMKLVRPKEKKGKQRADPHEEMHIHKAAQISQIHDLFPNLPNPYILKLLDHFNEDVEAVIAGLLEPDSLPQSLQDPPAAEEPAIDISGPHHDLAPRSTPPLLPQRRNVFDNDDFDNLRISTAKLHKGRKEIQVHQDESANARSKAAILAALAAFDSDDDERDDSYDVADVGASVDNTYDTDSRPRQARPGDHDAHEELLFKAWKDNTDLFARDSKTRVSNIRQQLKRDTGLSDEQIEGWAIMLKKDSNLQTRLDTKYSAAASFGGNQKGLPSTRWRANASGTEDSHDDDGDDGERVGGGDGRRMGQAQIRGTRNWGRGGGGGRGGGNTAGPVDAAATQAARRRKEQGRGRGGASHNRREGRAKKMGRGMAGPTAQ